MVARLRCCSSCCSPATSCCARCARRWASPAAWTICSGCSPAPSWRRWRRCRCSAGCAGGCRAAASCPGPTASSSLNLLLFALRLSRAPDNVWIARTFYIWLSVFNLVAISVAWSVLVDVFADRAGQAPVRADGGRREPGRTGRAAARRRCWSSRSAHAGLLLVSAVLLALGDRRRAQCCSAGATAHPLARRTMPRSARSGRSAAVPSPAPPRCCARPTCSASPLFVLLLASVSTFLYFEQARLVAERFPDRTDQTRVFGTIDIGGAGAGDRRRRCSSPAASRSGSGVGVLLVAVPLVMACGFLWLAMAPVVRGARGGDGGAPRRRVRVRAARPRDAVHRRAAPRPSTRPRTSSTRSSIAAAMRSAAGSRPASTWSRTSPRSPRWWAPSSRWLGRHRRVAGARAARLAHASGDAGNESRAPERQRI